MSEELEQRIDEEKLEQLVGRIREAYENGLLRISDWLAMYEILINACERDKAETMEEYLADALKIDEEESE